MRKAKIAIYKVVKYYELVYANKFKVQEEMSILLEEIV